MKKAWKGCGLQFLVCVVLVLCPAEARASQTGLLARVAFEQKLNAQLPLEATFTDDAGRTVTLGECLNGNPAILVPGYNRCPMLCSLVLNGVVESLRSMKDAGAGFEVISLSINPDETPKLAADRKRSYLASYGRPDLAGHWHFLTGNERAIRQVTDAIGFDYAFDPASGEYAHASGIVVLTRDGRVSQYFFGVQYPPRELREAIERAAGRRIGSPIRRLLLLCFHYDPENSRYGGLVTAGLRAGALLTLGVLALGILRMLRKESKGTFDVAGSSTGSHSNDAGGGA